MDAVALLIDRPDLTTYTWAVLAYLLPILLYSALSALAFLGLAWQPLAPRRAAGWSALILLLPVLGAVLCLTTGPAASRREVPVAVVTTGGALVLTGYLLTWLVLT